MGCHFTFTSPLGDVDFLGDVEPIGGFEALEKSAITYDLGGVAVKTIALDDLIRVKQYVGRPKDQAALQELLAVKRMLNEQGDA